MGIELLALGLDGVIFDTEASHLRACNAAFGEAGLALRWETRQFREAARVRGATHAIDAAIEGMGSMTKQQAEALKESRARHFHADVLSHACGVQPGFARLMDEALETGCKLAIVTDLPAPAVSALLERGFGNAFNQIFSVIVSGASFHADGGRSPHELVLRTVGIQANQCVAIHNAAPALRAAQRAGIWTVAVTPYDKEVACISSANLWCPQLQELRELAGARRSLRGEARRDDARRFVDFGTLATLRRAKAPCKPGFAGA
jgi:beta-phosphoglucomutase-like phosphatase (HAD superfamily)